MMASDGGGGGALDGEEGWEVRMAQQPHLQVFDTTTIMTTTTATASPGDVGRGGYGGSSYGGGGGGKSRASRFKSGKKGLPYERPSVGRSAAAGPQAAAILSAASTRALAEKAQGAKAWLGSGFSKIISTGATYLYSSIFRRNNPAPLPVLDVEAQQSDEDEQISSPTVDADNNRAGNEQNGVAERHNHVEPQVVNSSNFDAEKLLAKKTLSRDEFQRLTELLQSRVVSNGLEKKQPPKHVDFDIRSTRQDLYPSGGNQSEAQRWRQDLQKSREEREAAVRTVTVYENGRPSSTTQAGVPESLDALSSSPVEVAIAFMGGRGSRLSETPSTEPLNQRDEDRMSSGPPLSLNAPQTLPKWTAPDFLNEDQFSTPPPPTLQSWGHHRTISRTPYSRPLRLPPSRERAIDGTFGTPSATRWTPIRTPVTGGREMLKRRSIVLDEGWSSGGPIRRTRHKAVVSATPAKLSQSRGVVFPATPVPSSSLLGLPTPIGGMRREGTPSFRNASPPAPTEKTALTPSGNFYVPAQSSATARKILETLEKMTPSPKGKSLGDELAYVRGMPPTALTEGMLNDQARKSMTFVDDISPSDSREAGPSGRTAEEDPLSSGYPGSSFKMSDASPKFRGKGKGPLSTTESGPSGPSGLLTAQERTGTVDSSANQPSVRPKEPVTGMAAAGNNKAKGFRMSAAFEESGSEDEGLKIVSPPPSTPKLLATTSTSSTVTTIAFGAASSSPLTTSGTGLLSFSASIPAVDTSKAFSSGFSFPTRASLEAPPTPKAMTSASIPPKSTTATPFFQLAQTVEPLAASGSTAEASSTPVKAESQPETKTEFSFGSPAPVANIAQAAPKSQPTHEFSNSIFKQSSPPLKALSPAFASAVFPTFTSGGGTSPSAPPTSPKLGDTLSAPVTCTSFNVATISTTSAPFGQLFASNSSPTQSGSVIAPSVNLFASNTGSGTAPAQSFFGSDFKPGILAAPAFGQSNSFAFKNTSTTSGPLVSPDSKTSGIADNSTPSQDPERPQKRSNLTSFQQDVSNRQQLPSHIFTSFGTTLATSAATPAIPVSFAAGGQNTSASQGLFSVPSFRQVSSSASQTASTLPSPVGIAAFPFGAPGTSAGSTSSASSSVGLGSTPSFPSFPSSVFGTVSSGSTFGLTPAPAPAPAPAPLAFGSTATTLAFSTSANSVFGGFTSEAVSQSPPAPVFGSGFTAPSPSTSSSFSFGSSSPAFSFGPRAASSSGSAFTFGSAGSFPFAANKTAAPSPVFGLSSSVPAFGSTTNGTMANDVVVNDQSNMDDNSMAEEPSQMGGSVSPQASIFGAQSNAGTGSFVFGAQAGAPGATGQPLFGGFSIPTNPTGFGAVPANPFAAQPAGSLDFTGGSFTLGSGGDNRPQRKMFKAKRTGAKRGK
ncbi:unnamed protein product [Calypogeia fissa]